MRFSEKAFLADGWTTADSAEFLNDEILWYIKRGEYQTADEALADLNSDGYVEEFTDEEYSIIENAVADRLEELEQIEREDEEAAEEYEQMIKYLNMEYLRSVAVA